jgi:lipopolysaccharide transport system ATP-binding protein
MSSRAVITVDSVSKAFQVYAKPGDVFKEAIFGGIRHDLFWALRDVSFEVSEGQRLGIIGANGAGKSTLLQMISGHLAPTSGSIAVNGKISALLSVVPAWNAEDTGLENIQFNLLMLGCEPARIPALTEEIIDFTELGSFIYRPVKTYSTGMGARLAFAIATAVSPEILIIDEVLGVGDGYFASKAQQRLKDMCDRGRALLLVSHSLAAVRSMCDSVLWIQEGVVRLSGPAEYVLKQYEADQKLAVDETQREGHKGQTELKGRASDLDAALQEGVQRFRLVPKVGEDFHGTHYVRSIRVGEGGASEHLNVPLEIIDIHRDESSAALDIVSSEWGRLYERRGSICRALKRTTGRRRGGHFLARIGQRMATESVQVALEVEVWSPDVAGEGLTVQFLNPRSATWDSLTSRQDTKELGDWRVLSIEGSIPQPKQVDIERLRKVIAEEEKPEVEILECFCVLEGERTTQIHERDSFEVHVRIHSRRRVAVADVGIKLMRADGVFVFWQSSGMDGNNLRDLTGNKTVIFRFVGNCIGSGLYLLSAFVGNGWDLKNNYPHSRIYSRQIDALKLEVLRDTEELDLGIVNVRAEVEIR